MSPSLLGTLACAHRPVAGTPDPPEAGAELTVLAEPQGDPYWIEVAAPPCVRPVEVVARRYQLTRSLRGTAAVPDTFEVVQPDAASWVERAAQACAEPHVARDWTSPVRPTSGRVEGPRVLLLDAPPPAGPPELAGRFRSQGSLPGEPATPDPTPSAGAPPDPHLLGRATSVAVVEVLPGWLDRQVLAWSSRSPEEAADAPQLHPITSWRYRVVEVLRGPPLPDPLEVVDETDLLRVERADEVLDGAPTEGGADWDRNPRPSAPHVAGTRLIAVLQPPGGQRVTDDARLAHLDAVTGGLWRELASHPVGQRDEVLDSLAAADAPVSLGPFTLRPPVGSTVNRSDEVASHVVPEGFTERTYAGDVWITPAGADPHHTLILARLDVDPANATCGGAMGKALALGATLTDELTVLTPRPGCSYTLHLPGDRIEFVRARTRPEGTLELECFGRAADADALHAWCTAMAADL